MPTILAERLLSLWAWLRAAREDGQGLVEYALILMLVALVMIIILGVLGHQVNNVYSNVSNLLNT